MLLPCLLPLWALPSAAGLVLLDLRLGAARAVSRAEISVWRAFSSDRMACMACLDCSPASASKASCQSVAQTQRCTQELHAFKITINQCLTSCPIIAGDDERMRGSSR